MKKIYLAALLIGCVAADAQNRSNVWELSYSTDLVYPNCEMHYMNGAMDTNSVARIMSFFDTDASICDTNGNLLFYTNGLTIGNRNYDTLQNAVNFNPGWASYINEPDGLSTCQGALILPYPGHSDLYCVFHVTGEQFFAHDQYEVQPLHLSYSVIDMNLDNGLGGVIDTLKNIYTIEDTLTWGGLTAVKHANGRDWWVIMHRYYSDKYYKLLLTPNGIEGPFQQTIGSVITQDIGVQSTFSPDGTKFCFSTWGGWFDYIQFDRCTGQFFNSVTIYSPDSLSLGGNSFSPNNRFIYISSLTDLYQYDTWDSNMVIDVSHVATWDSFADPIYQVPVLFFMHQLASDGKIYLSAFNGSKYYNVVTSPDSIGLVCNFQPHSYIIPQYSDNIPSFPNYDLDSLPGVDTCNIIYTNDLGPPKDVGLYRLAPNPVSSWLDIIYQSNQDALFELFDMYGKRVAAISLFHYFKNRLLNVSDLPAGIYLATVTQNGKRVWSEKVVVTR